MIACFRCIRVPSKNRTAPNRTALPAWPTQLRRHSESHPFPSPLAPASSGLIITARTPSATGPGSTEGFCQQATEADAPPPPLPHSYYYDRSNAHRRLGRPGAMHPPLIRVLICTIHRHTGTCMSPRHCVTRSSSRCSLSVSDAPKSSLDTMFRSATVCGQVIEKMSQLAVLHGKKLGTAGLHGARARRAYTHLESIA